MDPRQLPANRACRAAKKAPDRAQAAATTMFGEDRATFVAVEVCASLSIATSYALWAMGVALAT